MFENNKFTVCVRCMTYNQALYIEDALNGFCMQETSFPFVCVIVDDASTDGEPDVIRNYLRQNFELEDQSIVCKEETDDFIMIFVRHKTNTSCCFAVYFLKYNHWCKKDKMPYYEKLLTNSKYVATCEGDDYWIDRHKLQKQVTYLETHPDCALCYTKAKRCYHGIILGNWGDEDYSFYGLLNNSIIPTLTRLERISDNNDYVDAVNPHNRNWLMGDYSNVLYYSLVHKIGYIDDFSAVYRVVDESSSHSKDISKLFRFYDSADDIRYFFINNYVASTEERNFLKSMVKRNEVSYKLNQYTQRYMIKEAAELYRASCHVLPKMKRVKYWLETFSRIISPVFIFVFNIKQFIKNHIKKLYLSI